MRNLDDPQPLGAGSFLKSLIWSFAKFASIIFLFEAIFIGIESKFELRNVASKFNMGTLILMSLLLLYVSFLWGWAGAMHKNMPRASLKFFVLGAATGSSFVTFTLFVLTTIYDPQPTAVLMWFFFGLFFMSWISIAGAWGSIRIMSKPLW